MPVILAPILEGKLEAWKAWATELNGPRAEEFREFNQRYGLTRHTVWLADTPAGNFVVVLQEGPGAETLMPAMAASTNPADEEFKQRVLEFHGLDIANPPPGPPPQLYMDSGS